MTGYSVFKINKFLPKNKEENSNLKLKNWKRGEVAELLNEEKQSGTYSITHLSSGVYFYSITAGNFR